MAKDKDNKDIKEQKPLNKRFVIFGIIVLIVVAVVTWLLISYASNNNKGEVEGVKTEDTQAQEEAKKDVPESAYFSEDAKIMFFYSDGCSWCQKEKVVLGELSAEGYKVKPMNVGKDTSLWEEYKIDGTPTFIAPNGDRLPGYTEKDELKKWMDSHLK